MAAMHSSTAHAATTTAQRMTRSRTYSRLARFAVSAPSTASSVPPKAMTLIGLRRHMRWLQCQANEVDANIASMTSDYVRMGEASDWTDARLPDLDETITFWQNRYRALVAQLAATRALFVSLMIRQSVAQ